MVELVIKELNKPDFIVGSFENKEKAEKWIEKANLPIDAVPDFKEVAETNLEQAMAQKEDGIKEHKKARKELKDLDLDAITDIAQLKPVIAKILKVLSVK